MILWFHSYWSEKWGVDYNRLEHQLDWCEDLDYGYKLMTSDVKFWCWCQWGLLCDSVSAVWRYLLPISDEWVWCWQQWGRCHLIPRKLWWRNGTKWNRQWSDANVWWRKTSDVQLMFNWCYLMLSDDKEHLIQMRSSDGNHRLVLNYKNGFFIIWF